MATQKTKKITVRVKAKHITTGVAKDCSLCPVAKALVDAGFKAVFAGPYFLELASSARTLGNYSSKKRVRVKTPSVARDFMHTFDLHLPVKPFTFKFEVPVSVLKAVGFQA
jgi:hypothetical protein